MLDHQAHRLRTWKVLHKDDCVGSSPCTEKAPPKKE
jgi:hypothetical protein